MARRKVSARTARPQGGTTSPPPAREGIRVKSGRLIAGPAPASAG
ncbi:hypothetical protein [Streptomyces griseorubiginosus]